MAPAVISRLLALTNEHNKDIKIAAIYALGEGGDPSPTVLQSLLALTNDLNNDVKVAAIKALGRVSRPIAAK
ncbi:HEAT repeat domain-containing protein [Yersinia rohdei]|uniref:HEAT repeat domain-containing protein n=1 Tax=Yersinia rohdei TaxID=29485 RepID=UPI0011A6023C|nr:HEAT repeat domain-containing protein [Yersinia rohdei]